MKHLLKSLMMCFLLASGLLYLSGCNNDDDPGPQLTGDTKSFDLEEVSDSNISGTVTFAERDDDQVLITIQLTGTQSGGMHPAHIHADDAATGGGIVLNLTDVDGATGKSETVVNALNDGTALTYEDLVDFDGHVNVHQSSSDMGTYIAQGDIGQNELTGDEKVYTLGEVGGSGVSGTASFAKRKNGNTQITLSLQGTTAGGDHPAHIHANNATGGGGIVIDLKNVNGETGKSVTSVKKLNDVGTEIGAAITYDGLLVYNGHINVHESPTNLVTRIAQGNIGSNVP